MTATRLLGSAAAGVTAFAAGFYLALAVVVTAVGIDEPFETRLELLALLFGAILSVLAVSVTTGEFRSVILRVVVAGATAAAGAGAALALIESDVVVFAIAGLLVVAAEVTAARVMS